MAKDRTRTVRSEDRCGVPNPATSMGSECVIIGHNHDMHRALNGDRWPAAPSAVTKMDLTSEGVRDLNDRRRVVYWRWSCGGVQFGAVSRKPEGWRALIYREDADGNRNTELGMHDTRPSAEQAVREWAERNPERIREGGR